MDVRATIAQQLAAARGGKRDGNTGERGTRWVNEQIGMHRDTLSRIERGLQPPTVAQALTLLALYGVEPLDLPIARRQPTKVEQMWAREVYGTLTVEQIVALAWMSGHAVDDTGYLDPPLLDGKARRRA